jgi:RimJ/RimL family protein N-acetyltransferase
MPNRNIARTSPRRPEQRAFVGAFVVIEPLSAARHGDGLFSALGGAGKANLWTWMADGPFADRDAFRATLSAREEARDPLFFTLLDKSTGHASGYAALMRVDAGNGVVEIGHVMFGDLARRPAATEAMYLLASYVFDDLGYRRLEWKCDDRNAASKSAALRLGFRPEGLFRQHMIVKGANRDTAWFALLDHELPPRKAAMAAWLAPDNFDANGRQKTPLARAG